MHSDLYQETMKNLDDFQKDTSDNKALFQNNAPFQMGNLQNEKAFSILAEYKENAKALRKKENTMKFGIDLF